jgi:hypothetical protein
MTPQGQFCVTPIGGAERDVLLIHWLQICINCKTTKVKCAKKVNSESKWWTRSPNGELGVKMVNSRSFDMFEVSRVHLSKWTQTWHISAYCIDKCFARETCLDFIVRWVKLTRRLSKLFSNVGLYRLKIEFRFTVTVQWRWYHDALWYNPLKCRLNDTNAKINDDEVATVDMQHNYSVKRCKRTGSEIDE